MIVTPLLPVNSQHWLSQKFTIMKEKARASSESKQNPFTEEAGEHNAHSLSMTTTQDGHVHGHGDEMAFPEI